MERSDVRVDFKESGTELKWCLFTKAARGSIGKIIVKLDRQRTSASASASAASAPTTAHIASVYVHPSYRGQGLGEELVDVAKRELRANGFVYLTLDAEENASFKFGKLVALYKRCGFEVYPPGLDHFPIEYNGDEMFRKVPMRCALQQPQQTITTTTACPLAHNLDFSVAMRQEVISRLQEDEGGMRIPAALEWVERELDDDDDVLQQRSRTFTHTLAGVIRSRGHPDWMELAGYLLHLGRIQFKHTEWRAPFRVAAHHQQRQRRDEDDEEEEEEKDRDDGHNTKCGPLPRELLVREEEEGEEGSVVLDDELAHSHQGLDECTLSWTPCEYTYTVLTHRQQQHAFPPPREIAQVLRYHALSAWLDDDGHHELDGVVEEDGSDELKEMTLAFRECVRETRRLLLVAPPPPAASSSCRLDDLLEKYLDGVRVL